MTDAGMALAESLSIEHLYAELARIDVLVRRETRRWRQAGQDPSDRFRGLYITHSEIDALLTNPIATSWGQTAALTPDAAEALTEAENEANRRAQELFELARSRGEPVRLIYLAAVFGLDRFDLDILLVCLAPTLDLRYERFFGYLQNDVTRKRPSVNLVLDLLCPPGPERLMAEWRFADDAPLFKYQLLERVSEAGADTPSLLSQSLRVDEAIVAWLMGRYQPHADLGRHASLVWPEPSPTEELLAAPAAERLDLARLRSHPIGDGSAENHTEQAAGGLGDRPILALYGPDKLSQMAAATRLAAQATRPLLIVDLAAVIEVGSDPFSAVRLALRDARLNGAVPYLSGWDACLTDEGAPPPDLLTELCDFPDLALVAGKGVWQARNISRTRALFWLEFPVPDYSQRFALWEHFLATENSEHFDLGALAGQFALTSGKIRDAITSARDRAAQEGRSLQAEDLFAGARAHSNPNLSNLARKIQPRYSWADIVLPEDQLQLLREIVVTVRGRPLVLEEWGIGKKLASSAGVTVLFSGPPGTGKTMAAEVIAGDLGLDLYKIDLSTIVSKYIGETEKNLERIFNEAQRSNAILFFDEADAIFGKRSEVKDAHDRYANIEVSYLLQRMEMYDGVTILATNLRANLDEAFTRRLQFAVDFPFPDERYRQRIWQTLFPPEVPCDPGLDFDLLARRFRLAGGNIRNILVGAAYLAVDDGKKVTMDHLLHATRRELQKMGRLVDDEDLMFD